MNLPCELKNFTLYNTTDPLIIYFEHNRVGDECAGNLWFEDKTLVDYDGVFELPREIIDYFKSENYDMSYTDDILFDNELPHST